MCKLPNKPTVTCLSFRHTHTHTQSYCIYMCVYIKWGNCCEKQGVFMCELRAVTCLSFRHAYTHTRTYSHTNRVHKHILPSCRVTYGGPFSWSVAHYISHYVFTHIWPILCTCWGVIYRLSVHTCSFSSSSCSSLRRSISPSRPPSHTPLPITPSVYLSPPPARLIILPMYLTRDHAVARATAAIVYPLPGDWSPWQWSRILKRRCHSSSPR